MSRQRGGQNTGRNEFDTSRSLCQPVSDFPVSFVNDPLTIRLARNDRATAEALAEVLLDCVEGGASNGFMQPLSRAKAVSFCRSPKPKWAG
jgi:hypothetical protein